MNLLNLAEKLAGETQTPLAFEVSRCLHSVDKSAGCTACVDVCPGEAITAGSPPQFEADACERCFACLPLCPTGAFAMEDELPHVMRCLGRLDVNTVELVCQHHPKPSLGLEGRTAAIQVRGCLAGLGVAGYLQLAATSLQQIVVRTDACPSCPWQALPQLVLKQVHQVQAWLQGWQRADFVKELSILEDPVKRPVHCADAPPVSRRDLFRGRVQEPPPADVTPSLNPFHQRLRTVNALQELSVGAYDAATPLPVASGFAMLMVDPSCSACGTCARACPSGALVLEQDDNGHYFQLAFSRLACLACDVCTHICPEQAITMSREATLGQVLDGPADIVLYEGKLAQCKRCNGAFAAEALEDGYCAVCAFRLRNPFVSRMPGARLGVMGPGEKA